jgi:hypothetical protein
MEGFDVGSYGGVWYEHAYHDWTQFAEVYDTTLDIRLSDDKSEWTDDFAVKGPSPQKAPRSWRGSPVANGAHYPLYGTLDAKNPNSGELRESGFGNVRRSVIVLLMLPFQVFPNYIVDVRRDPVTKEYVEAIQFQCLESGGVRVFEGINFLSRNQQMTDAELGGMRVERSI